MTCELAPRRWNVRGHGNGRTVPMRGQRRSLRQPQRFDYQVNVQGCWIWQGYFDRNGYGRVPVARQPVWAHRFFYEHHVGPIPEGLHLDHLCRTPACVNPDHLEPVTPAENCRRAALARVECANGHEWTPENTYCRPDDGTRQCRVCKAEHNRQAYFRNRDRINARRRAQYAAKGR
jgi:hypothetical protein